MINGLDLFSGLGGISYALKDYVRPLAYCESDTYCQAILIIQMANKRLYNAPIYTDIRSLKGSDFSGLDIDIIFGGFPCQDISVAGHGKGLAGERSGLYWEIHRLAKEILPKFIFLENVPAICIRGGWEVVSSLAEIGYDCRWTTLSACTVGAPHKRERWWLLAHSNSSGSRGNCFEAFNGKAAQDNIISELMGSYAPANSESFGMQEGWNQERIKEGQSEPVVSGLRSYWQETESPICGVDDGPPHRVDRIRAVDNAVVPQCAKKAFEYLMGITKGNQNG